VLRLELDRMLTARGWTRTAGEDDMEWFRPLADGLEIGLDVFEDDDGTIAADVDVHHARAQRWLSAQRTGLSAYLPSELAEAAGRDRPLAWGSPDLVACAAEIAALADAAAVRLAERAGTRALYLAALAEDPERAEHLDAIAAALDAEGEPPPPAPRPQGPTALETYERNRARRAAIAAVDARDLPDAGARAAALEAELQARGLDESPLWIRTRAERDTTSLRVLASEALSVFRRIRDGETDTGGVPVVSGPWLAVTLDPAASDALAAAYEGAPMRIAGTSTVAAQLTPDGSVVLGEAVIGRIEVPGPETTTPTQLQLARPGDSWFAQAMVPEP
jgi:hypothetical protein